MQTSTQAVRARTDEPFLERFIQAHEAFVLRCASRHAALRSRAATMNTRSRCWPFTKPSRLRPGKRAVRRVCVACDWQTPCRPLPQSAPVRRGNAACPADVRRHGGPRERGRAMQQAVAEQMSEAKPVSAQDEIEAANTVFERYGFAFYDLAASSPKSDKTRRSCAAAAARCCIRRCCSRPCRARTACRSRRWRSSAACPRGRSPVTGITL